MKPDFVRTVLRAYWRDHGQTWEQAARTVIEELGEGARPVVKAELTAIKEEAAANRVLDRPRGVADPARHLIEQEVRDLDWYLGEQPGDYHWPAYRERLSAGSMRPVVADVDEQSKTIVAHLSDPRVRGLRKKGLVLGFVQSGKTANYTAVMAKAADAGYRLFIVLAGMHNGLRRQTQERLEHDLMNDLWKPLTTKDEDFGVVTDDRALLKATQLRSIAVVKKNAARLRRLRNWLRDIPEDIRHACPTLLLDDEADQATPNTRAAQDEMSAINRLIREIRAELPTGTYIGYTATPFANVFMDPDDDEDLYPSDFIIDLPRPKTYFGAEALFGRDQLDADDVVDDEFDLIRIVPDAEADAIQPPTAQEARGAWPGALVPSLRAAVEWFVLATAARWARGDDTDHSSMLVHTSHYVDAHFAQQRRIDDLLDELRHEAPDVAPDRLRDVWSDETDRVPAERLGETPVAWDDVARHYPDVLRAVRTIADNGSSSVRLRYGDIGDDGRPIVETVIAIGGNTLSRGLTLEGLVVSYFVRASNTYDTLLQMGRWFGYRSGYGDLPRIWMTGQLQDDFRFLATVEEELRRDMLRYEKEQVTPRQFGLRVRQHPGRLAITARAKMVHARPLSVSFGGKRRQTFILHEQDEDTLAGNIDAAKSLAAHCLAIRDTVAENLFRDIDADIIIDFLGRYTFHDKHGDLDSDPIIRWIEKRADAGRPSTWNVKFMASTRATQRIDGELVDLGTLDLGLAERLNTFNRAPLQQPAAGTANIKTLMSRPDRLIDLDLASGELAGLTDEDQFTEKRRELDPDRGLLLVYPVSKVSQPMRFVNGRTSRRHMEAPRHLVGLGLVFPFEPGTEDQTYIAVEPTWEPEPVAQDLPLPEDEEGEAQIDGGDIARNTEPA